MFKQKYSKEFKCHYANWEGLKSLCLTFDVDFAPDYMIENVISILEKNKIKATFFSTHKSKLLAQLSNEELFEIALHPNLSANSTQGTNLDEIINDLKGFYPSIKGNRFHILSNSYRDLMTLNKYGFKYDVSNLLFNCPYLLPAYHKDIDLVLFTYVWEDGICENSNLKMKLENIDLETPGMKIINFHPMNIYINGETMQKRLDFLKQAGNLLECPKSFADKFRENRDGAGKVIQALVDYIKSSNCYTYKLNEAAFAFMNY